VRKTVKEAVPRPKFWRDSIVGDILKDEPWNPSLTRDPRAQIHREHIEGYFGRRIQVLGEKKRLIEILGYGDQIVTKAIPIIEPVLKSNPNDTKLWNILVRTFHSLPFMGGVGRYIRFFIRNSIDNQIVGCLSLGSAVLKCADRDKWIGWNMEERLRNLNKVANNRRFMILPHVRVRNLASRALSLLCGEGAEEWQRRYGDPLVLIETFVDSEHQGTCYKASNWVMIGETKGFTHIVSRIKKSADKNVSVYVYTGRKKKIFARPLRKSWRNELTK